MDMDHPRSDHWWSKSLIHGLRALEKGTAAAITVQKLFLSRYSKNFKNGFYLFLFLTITVVLAWLAHDLSRQRADAAWHESHAPSIAIWRQAFTLAGLQEVKNLQIQQQVFRQLPLSFDRNGSLWKSEDSAWWLLYIQSPLSDELTDQFLLYTRLRDSKIQEPEALIKDKKSRALRQSIKQVYQPLGWRWPAFDTFMEETQKNLLQSPVPSPSASPKKSSTDPIHIPKNWPKDWKDPREIQY